MDNKKVKLSLISIKFIYKIHDFLLNNASVKLSIASLNLLISKLLVSLNINLFLNFFASNPNALIKSSLLKWFFLSHLLSKNNIGIPLFFIRSSFKISSIKYLYNGNLYSDSLVSITYISAYIS